MENLIRQYIAAYNQMDVPGMVSLLHDVIVFENLSQTSGNKVTSGKTAFETLANQSLGGFEHRRQTIRSLTLGERTAAVEIEFDGMLKTGQTLSLRGVSVFAFSDGKISRISDYS